MPVSCWPSSPNATNSHSMLFFPRHRQTPLSHYNKLPFVGTLCMPPSVICGQLSLFACHLQSFVVTLCTPPSVICCHSLHTTVSRRFRADNHSWYHELLQTLFASFLVIHRELKCLLVYCFTFGHFFISNTLCKRHTT